MANIGDQLNQPEPGWRRFDDIVPQIKRIGVWNFETSQTYYYGGSVYLTYDTNAELSFKFYGTSLRLIVNRWINKPDNIPVEIDGVPAGTFSCYTPSQTNTALQYRILAYEITGLEETEHTVVIKTPSGMPSNQNWNIDAIDIDDTGYLLHPDEVIDVRDLEVGKRIRCHYASSSNTVGVFSGLGEKTSDFIPAASSANPNGDFYWICVDRDYLGRWKLIADRNIQHSISWDNLNTVGIASGSGLPYVITGENLCVGGTPISGGDAGGTSKDSAFDGSISGSTWASSQVGTSANGVAYIGYDFGEGKDKEIRRIKLYQSTDINGTVSSIKVQRSADKITWVDVVTVSGLGVNLNVIDVPKSSPSRYWRLLANSSVYSHGWTWNVYEVEMMEETSLSKNNFTIRLLTGGVSSIDKENEWDRLIVNGPVGSDNAVWNWNGIWSQTSTTNTSGSGNRTVRGYSSVGGFSYISPTSTTVNVNTGFRPVLLIEFLPPIKFEGSLDKTTIHNENVILSGTITEDENLDVQYRIEINGVQIYPETGYTSPQTPPLEISHEIANSYFRVGLNLIRLYVTNGSNETNFDFFVTLTNEVPMIETSMIGMKIDATITDDDNDDVQYNVYLNGKKIYPTDGDEYTEFITPPITFSKLFKENEIYIGQNNVLTINVRDIYGGENTVTVNFVGDYTGLMFMDGSGNYYSTNLGDVIKYLDFGDIYAGTTSHVMKVIIKNTNPNVLSNIRLKKMYDENVLNIEISKTNDPFIPESELNYNLVLAYGDTLEFYIRLTPNIEVVGGQYFELNVEADPVSIQ